MKQLIRKYFLFGALLIGASTQAATVGLTAITVNGDKMVNDSVLGVTWADIVPNSPVIFDTNTPPDANSAQGWIITINNMNYGGHNDWRLASAASLVYTSDYPFNLSTCSSTNPSTGELDCLFYNELGNLVSSKVDNYGPFTQMANKKFYWSGTPTGNGRAYSICTETGSICEGWISGFGYYSAARAIAVRTGLTEVAPVPIPASAWLLLSGLGGLGLMSRKRKTRGG